MTQLREIRAQWNPLEFLVDNDLGSKYFGRLARVMAMQSGQIIVPREIPTGGKSKLERAISFQGLARMGHIRTKQGDWVGELKREISTFPREGSGYFDDQIDVLSLFSNYLSRMAPGQTPVNHKPPPPIEGAVRMQDGQMVLTETLDSMFEQREEALSARFTFGRI